MDCSAAAADSHLRRMISNRESARRSRMRKQRHLEDLRSRVGRLRLKNRAIADMIAAVSGRCFLLRQQNDHFKSESAALRRRLSDIRRLLFLRQLDCLSPPPPPLSSASSSGGAFLGSANEHILASLIA